LAFASLASPSKLGWQMLASLASPSKPGECRRVWRVWRVWRVRHISEKDHFGKYSNSPKMANFRRVLKFDKFAVEWPLLSIYLSIYRYFSIFPEHKQHVKAWKLLPPNMLFLLLQNYELKHRWVTLSTIFPPKNITEKPKEKNCCHEYLLFIADND
jgi:hypothetical protein